MYTTSPHTLLYIQNINLLNQLRYTWAWACSMVRLSLLKCYLIFFSKIFTIETSQFPLWARSMVQSVYFVIGIYHVIVSSLAPETYGNDFKVSFSYWCNRFDSWTFSVKLLSGACFRTPWLWVSIGPEMAWCCQAWASVDPDPCYRGHMASLGHSEFTML